MGRRRYFIVGACALAEGGVVGTQYVDNLQNDGDNDIGKVEEEERVHVTRLISQKVNH